MTGWLTEGNVRRLLRSYDELVWVAQLLANTVAGTRNVHYKPTDARDYEITFGEDTVYARWYHHGDYDSVNYPLRCLWLGHDETVNIVSRQIADATKRCERPPRKSRTLSSKSMTGILALRVEALKLLNETLAGNL